MELGLDQPFLDILPKLKKTLSLKTETGLVITWDESKQTYKHKWIKGDKHSVYFTPEMRDTALICVHTHPKYLYSGAKFVPPTQMDIRERIVDIIVNGLEAPNDYVIDQNGIWCVYHLTKSATEELDTIKRSDADYDNFLDVAMHNANNNGAQLVTGKIDLSTYLMNMLNLWGHGMGIEIRYVPYAYLTHTRSKSRQ